MTELEMMVEKIKLENPRDIPWQIEIKPILSSIF